MIAIAGAGYIWITRGIPFVGQKGEWAIGIYKGTSPLACFPPQSVKNPVLTARHVTDASADFVADPFMLNKDSVWYMFFEVMNRSTDQGDIGSAISPDGINWTYQQIVLDEPFHLSYPYVFEWNNDYYMIPESYQTNTVRLYKAVNFPRQWVFLKDLLKGKEFIDSSIFYYDQKWWLFTTSIKNDILHLYYANDLMGPWTEHIKSPVISENPHISRPGGRVLVLNRRILRYTQDVSPDYGRHVHVFEVTELTTRSYKEKSVSESPIIQAGEAGWNNEGMHQIDLHLIGKRNWIACVDGFSKKFVFGFEY